MQVVIIRNFGNVSLFIIFIIIFYKRGVFGKFRHRSNQQSHSFLEIEESSLPRVPDDFTKTFVIFTSLFEIFSATFSS